MDEQRPHEKGEPQFSNLPDVDAAWADMKARLDGEEKRRRFVLPPFLSGCGGWALLLLLLGSGGLWWYFSSGVEKERAHTHEVAEVVAAPAPQKERAPKTGTQKEEPLSTGALPRATAQQPKGKSNIFGVATKSTATIAPQQKKEEVSTRNPSQQAKNKSKSKDKEVKGKRNILLPAESEPVSHQSAKSDSTSTTTDINTTTAKDTATPYSDTTAIQKATDSVAVPVPDKERKSKRFTVAAGLSLQQQLPVAGQQWTPYNYLGRRGSLGDYVPAADLRLYKGNKWFMQAGFRYGAPQYTRAFLYNKSYKTDTLGMVQSSTALKLKKTYYHQVPVSFNYFIRPQWSIGAGVVYNKFFGAVSEKEDRQQLTPTTDSLVSKAIIRDRNDSLFRSSNWQLLFETQYQWKRFSVGARFTQGLQPFIHYTDAQGQPQKQKNHAVNLFIRYELWRQKR